MNIYLPSILFVQYIVNKPLPLLSRVVSIDEADGGLHQALA